jgi:4-hydroxy-4-methyl-2-oxoglutarate aldolase
MTQSETPPAVGFYRPPRIGTVSDEPPDPAIVARLRRLGGLSSAFSDALDEIGWQTAVPASSLVPLRAGDVVVGRALTLRYLPMRVAGPSRLAHLTAVADARPGDVLVVSAPPASRVSVLGGLAAAAAVAAGVAAIVVQGAVRDVDEIESTGLAVWSTAVTPITGRGRLDALEINGPVEIGGVQVVPGDVVVADRSGVAFVPRDRFDELAQRILAG